MTDLRTTYLGLDLEHPILASPSPISRSLDGIRQLEDGGAAAIVLFSLFEELIRRERESYDALAHPARRDVGERTAFPTVTGHSIGPESYLELLWRASKSVDVPVIGSLNGVTSAGWTEFARKIEEAGAAAIELNIYHIPADIETPGTEVEERYLEILRQVRGAVTIPLAVKLGPYFSSPGHTASRLVDEGADGLVLFNRFYQPDIDLESLTVEPSLDLSTARELRLSLLWIAILRGRVDASLAATTGVESGAEVMKYLLAGADAVMTTSALLRHGPTHCGVLREELETWLRRKELGSVREAQGALSREQVADPSAFERANYLRILEGYEAE